MDDSSRTCAWPGRAAMERTSGQRGSRTEALKRTRRGGEIEANMADWMCVSQSVGRSAAEGRQAGL